MNELFNRTFFQFAMGFVGVLMLSFALAVALTHIDRGSPVVEETTQ
jgi:hypothetical protein